MDVGKAEGGLDLHGSETVQQALQAAQPIAVESPASSSASFQNRRGQKCGFGCLLCAAGFVLGGVVSSIIIFSVWGSRKCGLPPSCIRQSESAVLPVSVNNRTHLSQGFANLDELESSIWKDYFEEVYGVDTIEFPLDLRLLSCFHTRLLPKKVQDDVVVRQFGGPPDYPPVPSYQPYLYGELFYRGNWHQPANLCRSIYPVMTVLDNPPEMTGIR
uniref:Uncharacterized protein n=1 Tax=Chromera velia CCMP2878 TaxID=1169474 RepID=A0A0G4FJ78_9ALVE|eukprot:Cvel_17114.t1-p1 / transcript=Cvel_17114.t1 / gene=Cvel_17114 / organism=Chromera_velia_CCMP2878 / gene_product=hypothetical protein / transcript_product=hypothetical protein / location=Cvel_scaffold1349:44321-45226(-) / protein_length=215 / sequence_SO=supercontig / SO=protein_coding / is_pseudo=false